MFPNPNDGNFILQQVIADNEPIDAEIWDVTGRSIYRDRLQFAGATTKLSMNSVAPGVYLLQLTDSSRRKFRFKFIVN